MKRTISRVSYTREYLLPVLLLVVLLSGKTHYLAGKRAFDLSKSVSCDLMCLIHLIKFQVAAVVECCQAWKPGPKYPNEVFVFVRRLEIPENSDSLIHRKCGSSRTCYIQSSKTEC